MLTSILRVSDLVTHGDGEGEKPNTVHIISAQFMWLWYEKNVQTRSILNVLPILWLHLFYLVGLKFIIIISQL